MGVTLELFKSSPRMTHRVRALGCFIVVLILTGRVYAAKHPVPLDPKADTSTCLACHEDKTKGKSIHSAMAMGCTSCHEIRVNKDITRVKLITTTPLALCLTCHADKNAADIKGTVHPPAVRDCVKCHDPHSSDYKNQLLKPTSGDQKENLCLSCHTTGLNVPEKGSRHAALDMGCETCHVTHKTGEIGKAEFDFHLTKAPPALCIDCHDVKGADLQKAHQNQPFETSNCVSCHDPHASAAPKLMAKFTHPPFADKQCEVCHAPAKNGKVVLTQADAKALCVTCHDDKAKLIDDRQSSASGGSGRLHRLPQPTRQQAARTSQNERGRYLPGLSQRYRGPSARSRSTTSRPSVRVVLHVISHMAATTIICCAPRRRTHFAWSAMDRRGNRRSWRVEPVITIFNGSVKLPDDYFAKNKVVVLPLKFGMGHPVAGHPVSDLLDPADPTKVKTPMSCLTCHQPHSSAQPDLLVKDQANNMAFCSTCHKDLKTR